MIKKCLENSTDPSVTTFRQINRKKLFKGVGGKKSMPNFCLDGNGALLRIRRVGAREEKREVVTLAKGKELVKSMHQRAQGVCKITRADSVGCSLRNDVILDKISVYADLQRNFVAARRKYKTNEESVSIEVLLKQVGIEKYDLSDTVKGEDEYVDDDPVESNPPFSMRQPLCLIHISEYWACLYTAEDDIIQPLCNFNEEKDDVFLQSRQQRLLMNKRSVYQVYCRVSKPMLAHCTAVYPLDKDIIITTVL